MTTTITIFYMILNDDIDKEMDNNMRKCINNGFAISNFQDRIFN